MQVISHATGIFSPIRASSKQAFTPKPVAEPMQTQALKSETAKISGIWEGSSFSFWDILDAINPLQHIPVISTIYRNMTGDEMGYAARITGDTLYGGLFGSLISGLVSAVANVFVDSTTGKDIGEHVLARAAPAQTPSKVPYSATEKAIAISLITPDSAAVTHQKEVLLPSIDTTRIQAGIDQYKWQIMIDEVKTRSNYWA